MDVIGILDKVARKYGLTADQLEAGTFSKGQSLALVNLFRKCAASQKDEDWEAYLEQKAKYITAKTEPSGISG